MRFLTHSLKIIPAVCAVAALATISVIGQTATGPKTIAPMQVNTAGELTPQAVCPVQGDPINKKMYFDYKDKRIYVCCVGCLDSVKANPQKYIDKLKAQGQSVETIPVIKKKAGKKASADTSKVSEAGYWTCPMHPEIHQATAGKCPICGMDLVYKKTDKAAPKTQGMDHSNMKM
jgi:hypothetical protein